MPTTKITVSGEAVTDESIYAPQLRETYTSLTYSPHATLAQNEVGLPADQQREVTDYMHQSVAAHIEELNEFWRNFHDRLTLLDKAQADNQSVVADPLTVVNVSLGQLGTNAITPSPAESLPWLESFTKATGLNL